MFKRWLSAVFVAFLAVATLSTPATAAIQNYQESPGDTFTKAGTPANFNLLTVSYAEFSESPEFHYFYLDFAAPVESQQFDDGLGSWAMVMIDTNNDGNEDFRIETGIETLEGNYSSPAYIHDVNRDREVSGCSAVFFSDIDEQAPWLGFKLPYNCLKLPKTFGIQGYADYIEVDDLAFDYAPEASFFRVSHRLASGSTITGLELPSVAPEALYAVNTPGSAPADLVALSPKVLKSVVTVFCDQGLGTGWAANVTIPASVSRQGMNTFLVTNHHVVEDCLAAGEVTITDNAGNSAIGYIASADESKDLAGIYTKMSLPTLSFRGERPAQGWWVGVLGSPRGLDGYLTTGLVSKVVADGSEFGVSASLNPGNSGGPIFDRDGRVLGVATYKLLESEGLGFARSSTLLCTSIVKCDNANPIWSTQLAAKPGSQTGGETAAAQAKSATLPAFAGKSSKLSATQQNSINRLLILNGWTTKFLCSGIVSTKATNSEKTLAKLRAKAACDFAKKQNPSLSTFYQVKTSTSKSSIGKVLVTLKN
jgi:S1-C subfamily serine protease